MTEALDLVLNGRCLRHVSGSPTMTLGERPASVLDRLLRQPGALLDSSTLITAVWPDPDAEPDSAEAQIRQFLVEVRRAVATVTGGSVRVRSERGVGWAIEQRSNHCLEVAA